LSPEETLALSARFAAAGCLSLYYAVNCGASALLAGGTLLCWSWTAWNRARRTERAPRAIPERGAR